MSLSSKFQLHRESPNRKLAEIAISRIRPNPYQPRKHFDEDGLLELAESIREVGVLQPVVVKPAGDHYELVVGERRFRASTLADLETIPAVIMDVDPTDQQVLALVENIHRRDLSAIEEAQSLREIIEKTGWSQSETAKRLGRSQAAVANKLRLLKLDYDVQNMVAEGKFGERQARALIGLSPAQQISTARKIIEDGLSAREVEVLVHDLRERQAVTSMEDEGEQPESGGSKRKKGALSFSGPEGPTGDLLRDLASLVEKRRRKGVPVVWKVKELAQSELVVEIIVDLKKTYKKPYPDEEKG